ncbi:EAL domain-containing protein [Nitratireductor luteus]|uniref:EAL domain-containing protein n=1 Tax=Nitratireductor luteus TaxID=2976980 RepID=UPI0022409766|nr:EAL domain-containing protein [Nitratireductor luteus]
MSASHSRLRRVLDATLIDEVGIETGLYGRFHIRTTYQPIMRNDGEWLEPCGIDGQARPFREGRAVGARTFFDEAPDEDRPFVETLCRSLHLGNYINVGVDGLDLYFSSDPYEEGDVGILVRQVEAALRQYEGMGVEPGTLVCKVAFAQDTGILRELGTEMRRLGVAIAVDDFGMTQSTLERMRALDPEIVKFDGEWFRRISDAATAVRLLALLVNALQREGRKVLIEGIETSQQLRAALETGADYLQGYLLGMPSFAGTLFDTRALSVEQLIMPEGNVVPLFDQRGR